MLGLLLRSIVGFFCLVFVFCRRCLDLCFFSLKVFSFLKLWSSVTCVNANLLRVIILLWKDLRIGVGVLSQGLGFGLGEQVSFSPFVFGSFSESESKFFQLPPPPEKKLLPKETVSVPSFQFGDLIAFDELRVSDAATSAPRELSPENGAAALPRLQIGSAESLERSPVDGAAVQGSENISADGTISFQKDEDVKEHSKAGRDEQGQAHAQPGNDQQASAKQTPKSWASLVGVQPVPGGASRTLGQVKSAPVPANKPVTNASPRLQPRGLINTGNSCFANSTLQALLSCPPFLNLLASIKSRNIPQVSSTCRAYQVFFLTCTAFHVEFDCYLMKAGRLRNIFSCPVLVLA